MFPACWWWPHSWSRLEVDKVTLLLWCQTVLLLWMSWEQVEQSSPRSSRSNYCEFFQETSWEDQMQTDGFPYGHLVHEILWLYGQKQSHSDNIIQLEPIVQTHQVIYILGDHRLGLEEQWFGLGFSWFWPWGPLSLVFALASASKITFLSLENAGLKPIAAEYDDVTQWTDKLPEAHQWHLIVVIA